MFGQIAAANALSDIYAMGGRPITALNIVGFPIGKMPSEVLANILKGGHDKITETGAIVVGGHSIKDQELKYGVAVSGLVHPGKIIKNSEAQPGDCLVLTKALGTGLITTGIKRHAVDDDLVRTVETQMATLNKTASELMVAHAAHAATDVTGFGLAGHALEMAQGSGVSIRLFSDKLPLLPKALELASAGMIPGGANDNRSYLSDFMMFDTSVDENLRRLVFDPQTSGGLLIAIAEANADAFAAELARHGFPHAIIGRVEPRGDFPLIIQ